MISIVTAYYNRRKLFERTLNSISKTKYDGDFEVIAVDDGSRTEERLEDLTKKYPFLKVIYLDPSKKWYHNSCVPFNIGIRAAKGDKIILQNPECYHYDDILLKTYIELNDKNYLSFACFSLDKYTTDHFEEVFNSDYLQKLIQQNNFSPIADGEAGWYNHSKYRPKAYHFCTAITSKNMKKLGGFDERFALGIAYDDDELIDRINRILEIKFFDKTIVLHQNHYNPQSTSYQNKDNKKVLYQYNKFILLNKLPLINFNKFVKFIPVNNRKPAIWLALKGESFLRYFGVVNKLNSFYYEFLKRTNRIIINQRKNPNTIPIIIVNFNQLEYLKKLLDFLEQRKFENIVIIDNKSTYPPLLDYYKTISSNVKIEYMDDNFGHLVFFKKRKLQEKYAKGYYILTDADIVPNNNLPTNFVDVMIGLLDKYFNITSKIGFALRIDDIPDYFPLKSKVINWERQFWANQLSENIYKADIDTTFALYKPKYPIKFENIEYIKAVRIAGLYTCKHGGWYKNPHNMTEEEIFYQKTANSSGSWNFDENNNTKGALNY